MNTDPHVSFTARHKYLGVFGMIWLSFLIMSMYTGFKTFELLGLTFTVSVLTYPFTYIFSDIFTEVYGYKVSRKIVWTGFLCLYITAFIGYFYSLVPSSAGFTDDHSFNLVFGASPLIASFLILGFFAGETLNSFILSKMKVTFSGKYEALRYITSTFLGQLADNTIYWTLAIVFASFIPIEQMFQVIVTSVVFCTFVEILLIPLTKKIIAHIKHEEQMDTFDVAINYNPFNFR